HVAKEVLGKGWQSLDSPQQHRFRETFARLYTAAAAARFEAPASFTAPAHESRTETLARVVSRRTEKRGKTADLEYVLHKVGARWRIIDTLEDGVSQLTDARAEFRRILEREGAPALLARLEQRLRSYGEPASKVVERLQAALLEAMKSGAELAHRVRAERLAPVIAETHDFPFIARFVVRRHWKDLSGQQRSDFVDQFRRLSVATYTSRFDSYNGEDFVLLGEKALRGGYLLVKSSLTKSDGKKVSFGYQMRKVGYRWVIVNIIVDGVSDLATKQAEYRGIIASKGFDDLVAKIEDQIQRYQSPEKK
ncbi:MAG: ABC transporter substrate-binding protein, partial [Planctomycetota bacterium]